MKRSDITIITMVFFLNYPFYTSSKSPATVVTFNIGVKVRHISYKAKQDDGTMLCPEVLSLKSYENKIKAMGADIASANYQQEPIDIKGRLYSNFKTYDKLPLDGIGKPLFTDIRNYTDTADEGSDYLCSICYGVLP